jgi:hypothetical protein
MDLSGCDEKAGEVLSAHVEKGERAEPCKVEKGE